MSVVTAEEITKTHFCKHPGCENEARAAIGRYAYCDEHQATRAAARKATAISNGHDAGAETTLRNLLSAAKRVDKAKAKAEKLQAQANTANKEADRLEREYREALAAAVHVA